MHGFFLKLIAIKNQSLLRLVTGSISGTRVRAPSEPLNSMTFPWQNPEIPRPFSTNLAHPKGILYVHKNINRNITYYFGPECLFYGIFPFSMTSDISKDFRDFSRPGNQSFKFHMTCLGFPWTLWYSKNNNQSTYFS